MIQGDTAQIGMTDRQQFASSLDRMLRGGTWRESFHVAEEPINYNAKKIF